MAVHDERGLADGFEFREPLAAGLTPFGDRQPLRRHRLCRCRYVDVFLPRMPSRPEHLAGRLAPLRRAKEQIKECLEWGLPGLWIGQAAVLGVFRVLRWFARSRPGAGENETADQFGMAYRKRLRDISSDREAQQIDLRKSERPDEIGGVLRHRIDRVRRLAARRGDPRIVEQNDRPIFRKAVGDRGIPMIHSAPKMLHEKKRRADLLSEPAVGEANPVGFNELRGGRDVLVCHIRSSCSALARTHRESPRIASVAWTELRNRLVSSDWVHHDDWQVSKKDRLPTLLTRDHPC